MTTPTTKKRWRQALWCTLVRATRRESWYLTPSHVKSRPSLSLFFSFFFHPFDWQSKAAPAIIASRRKYNNIIYIWLYNNIIMYLVVYIDIRVAPLYRTTALAEPAVANGWTIVDVLFLNFCTLLLVSVYKYVFGGTAC